MQENTRIKSFSWYNHPIQRPSGYHFCSAIQKNILNEVGGFDNRLQWGYAFEDDLFLHNVRQKAKLIIIPPEKGWVLHQYHETEKDRARNWKLQKLWKRNEAIFTKVVNQIV